MLEWEVTTDEQTQLEIIATLQGTDLGQQYYNDLCERQQHLQRLVSSSSACSHSKHCWSEVGRLLLNSRNNVSNKTVHHISII